MYIAFVICEARQLSGEVGAPVSAGEGKGLDVGSLPQAPNERAVIASSYDDVPIFLHGHPGAYFTNIRPLYLKKQDFLSLCFLFLF